MKKNIHLLLLIALSATSFGQQTEPKPTLTKQDYLQKSKNKKTGGWILLGVGSAIAIAGFTHNPKDEPFNSSYPNTTQWNFEYSVNGGNVIGGLGLACMAGSILFFVSAKKFKAKAMSVSFKMQQVPQFQKIDLVSHTIPSIILKISL